jgi:L-amino acid N-acyltransferase YncA
LVSVEANEVLGFSSFGEWRGAPCYRHTVEHSVHVAAARRGAGIGRALVEALFPRVFAMGKHVMIGGVDAENNGSSWSLSSAFSKTSHSTPVRARPLTKTTLQCFRKCR